MTTSDRKYSVGFIGIGKMGLPMASRIAVHGYPLHGYDISEAAIKGLNGKEVDGRALNVNEARPKAERGERGGTYSGSRRW